MTPFQLEESAKAPWTSTIVGFPAVPVVVDMGFLSGVAGRAAGCTAAGLLRVGVAPSVTVR